MSAQDLRLTFYNAVKKSKLTLWWYFSSQFKDPFREARLIRVSQFPRSLSASEFLEKKLLCSYERMGWLGYWLGSRDENFLMWTLQPAYRDETFFTKELENGTMFQSDCPSTRGHPSPRASQLCVFSCEMICWYLSDLYLFDSTPWESHEGYT